MKKYFRFGDIPVDGKSYNYLTKTKEKGVSAFELIEGIPFLWNLQLIDSFCSRLNSEPISFFVTGEEVGRGNDGEPLLKI